jgi:predicted lipoprotein with Yx(FWY)xxD motif
VIRIPPASARRALLVGAATCSLTLALAACGSTETPSAPAAAPSTSTASSTSTSSTTGSSTSASSSASTATVALGHTSLGDVVVDGKGMTLYMYTKDTKGSGKSACAGQCLVAWPPLIATGTPTADGVTGPLGTIDTPDGKKQVTLDGWPLYTYVKDTKPGDVTGQNVGQIWFVLDKTGMPIKQSAGGSTGY